MDGLTAVDLEGAIEDVVVAAERVCVAPVFLGLLRLHLPSAVLVTVIAAIVLVRAIFLLNHSHDALLFVFTHFLWVIQLGGRDCLLTSGDTVASNGRGLLAGHILNQLACLVNESLGHRGHAFAQTESLVLLFLLGQGVVLTVDVAEVVQVVVITAVGAIAPDYFGVLSHGQHCGPI